MEFVCVLFDGNVLCNRRTNDDGDDDDDDDDVHQICNRFSVDDAAVVRINLTTSGEYSRS